MKRILVIASMFTAALSAAQDGMLGTKAGGSSQFVPSNSSGGGLLQMIFAVVIVMVLMKVFLPKLMTKFGSKLSTGLNSAIKIEESASFAGGSLHLVTVQGRKLLLGSTPQSITTLADLGEVTKPDPGPTFMELVEAAPETEFAQPVPMDVMRANIEVAEDEAQAALRRLNELMR